MARGRVRNPLSRCCGHTPLCRNYLFRFSTHAARTELNVDFCELDCARIPYVVYAAGTKHLKSRFALPPPLPPPFSFGKKKKAAGA
jgi:hypothetical protein